MANVAKRVATNPSFAPVLKGILFSELDELSSAFGEAWRYADGEKARVFAN